jgi:DNA-binding NtrC family response regulator
MAKTTILWADDEIDLLKPQILFLKDKGYEVITVTNGKDAVDAVHKESNIDVVFLDESMPGLSGLQALTLIKEYNNHLPVVMITKNEEENLMEDAIGSQIADYLIKPVKPQQILSTLKKIINKTELVSEALHPHTGQSQLSGMGRSLQGPYLLGDRARPLQDR